MDENRLVQFACNQRQAVVALIWTIGGTSLWRKNSARRTFSLGTVSAAG
jgi:hypothetical protein